LTHTLLNTKGTTRCSGGLASKLLTIGFSVEPLSVSDKALFYRAERLLLVVEIVLRLIHLLALRIHLLTVDLTGQRHHLGILPL
jgi:hypothetical protein